MEERNLKDGYGATYQATYAQSFKAATATCQDLGLSIAKENYEKKYIVARSSGRTNGLFINYGELIGIYFDETSPNKVTITIVNKRRYKPGFLYYEDWTEDLHAGINNYLA